ncbi:uncharacterized protein TRUGW13939_03513 [Talaromyces rugulosus]|uniref:Large ribosomal subunit protein uL3m n=1 Tax=Talaromyces rugulosus TaxID=121627 RepID=A0A7H8QR90_TALRU|nr:uncharacterized protein TRUGW13939_03513 [Talaromyces rugulosus]QKX56408.1 hypothetical protein TRUGW13939_03513 [Talaromyces rugulosus]
MPPKLPREALCLGQPGWLAQILVNFTSKRQFGIRSLNPPKHTNFDSRPGLPLLKSTPAAALERKLKADVLPLRTGALATKQGMTAIYDPETGKRTACTVLQLDRVQVIAHKTVNTHGYFAVQVGAGWKKSTRVTRAMLGHFSIAGVSPKRYVQEFRVKDSTGLLGVGEEITADWFQEGQFVDARSNTKGKGFAGVMKRHGFHGQDRSHGVSLAHRSMGSSGPGQGGGSRVYPGKKMAGNMGGERNTLQNLKVLKVDSTNGIVVVSGSVSGPKGCIVKIQDALKKPWPKIEPVPKAKAAPEVEATPQ